MSFSLIFFFFSSRRRHTRWPRDWSSDVCSSDLIRLVRRGRDSNPRYGVTVYSLSRGAPSATRPPLRILRWSRAIYSGFFRPASSTRLEETVFDDRSFFYEASSAFAPLVISMISVVIAD